MSITYLDAEDEIFGICNTSWIQGCTEQALAYRPQLTFPGTIAAPPSPKEVYAECSYSVVTEHQLTLSSVGGAKLYETVGLFALQVYSPKTDATALRTAKIIAGFVRDAFCRSSPSGEVWFRDQRLTVVSGNEIKNQVNVVVVCSYKTQK